MTDDGKKLFDFFRDMLMASVRRGMNSFALMTAASLAEGAPKEMKDMLEGTPNCITVSAIELMILYYIRFKLLVEQSLKREFEKPEIFTYIACLERRLVFKDGKAIDGITFHTEKEEYSFESLPAIDLEEVNSFSLSTKALLDLFMVLYDFADGIRFSDTTDKT